MLRHYIKPQSKQYSIHHGTILTASSPGLSDTPSTPGNDILSRDNNTGLDLDFSDENNNLNLDY